MITDKEKLSPEKDNFNNLSTQLNMNKLNIFNNNIDNLQSNDFHSKTFPRSLNNNKYNNKLSDSLENKNDINKEINLSYPNLYTIKDDKIINFNLIEKKIRINKSRR